MISKKSFCILIIFYLLFQLPVLSQTDQKKSSPNIYYGDKGWHLETNDKKFSTDFQLRMQFRYAYPYDRDPVSLDDINNDDQHIFVIRRGRVKIGGNAFTSKFSYYMEFELVSANLLDYRLTYAFHKSFKVLVGQYKARYNTERVVSSGKQQTVDRSILTRPFTLDRQTGITLFGDLEGNGALNFSYWVSVLEGTGRGGFVQDEEDLMWMVRGQWNMFGEVMKFVSSDINIEKKWRGYLAGGWSTNESKFTRFSQSGGGQLEGYPEDGLPGQYKLNQYFVESAIKKSGVSWQQEFHRKEIFDKVNNSTRTLFGNYLQLGTFPAAYIKRFPQKLEFAFRYSFYVPDDENRYEVEEEFTFCTNWFFKDHRNKLTAEVTYFELVDFTNISPGWRFRFQWDISF